MSLCNLVFLMQKGVRCGQVLLFLSKEKIDKKATKQLKKHRDHIIALLLVADRHFGLTVPRRTIMERENQASPKLEYVDSVILKHYACGCCCCLEAVGRFRGSDHKHVGVRACIPGLRLAMYAGAAGEV